MPKRPPMLTIALTKSFAGAVKSCTAQSGSLLAPLLLLELPAVVDAAVGNQAPLPDEEDDERRRSQTSHP